MLCHIHCIVFCYSWCKMSSQELSGSTSSKLNLSLSQETVDYMWHSVSDIADPTVWSVLYCYVVHYPRVIQFLLSKTLLISNTVLSRDVQCTQCRFLALEVSARHCCAGLA